jgi:signal transduction histidine kinase
MTPDVKEKMFNPFFTTKPTGEGTGLGLSISHDVIVKQHAGSIEVDTQAGVSSLRSGLSCLARLHSSENVPASLLCPLLAHSGYQLVRLRMSAFDPKLRDDGDRVNGSF